jgi:hypothetical protein
MCCSTGCVEHRKAFGNAVIDLTDPSIAGAWACACSAMSAPRSAQCHRASCHHRALCRGSDARRERRRGRWTRRSCSEVPMPFRFDLLIALTCDPEVR